MIGYDENARVSSLRHVVNGTIATVGSEDKITSFAYETEQTTVSLPTEETESYTNDQFGNYTEDPAVDEAKAEFYADYAGIEYDAAKSNIDLQAHAAILNTELADQLGPSYTGEWFTPADRVEIGLTSEGYEQTVLQDLANLGLADNADIVASPSSRSQLVGAKAALRESVSSLVAAGRVAFGYRADEDALQVFEGNSLTTAQRTEIAEHVAETGVAGHYVQLEAKTVTETPFACIEGRCDRPLRGGMEIESHSGPNACSAGFLAHAIFSRKLYLFTAGHCIYGEAIGGTWQAETATGPTAPAIGKARAYVYGEHQAGATAPDPGNQGDAAIIEVEPKGYWLPTPESREHLEGFPSIVQFKGAEAPRNLHYRILGEATNTEKHEEAIPGQVVCVDGVGEPTKAEEEKGILGVPLDQCGIIETYGQEVETRNPGASEPEAFVYNLGVVNMCVKGKRKDILRPGTSGGPVVQDHRAVGLNNGSFTDESGEPCFETFTPIWEAERYLGPEILTTFSGY